MAKRVINIDPIRAKSQYDIVIDRGDTLTWQAPAGALNILIDFKPPFQAISPGRSGNAASRTFSAAKHPSVPNHGPADDPRGQISYTITIEYAHGYGTVVIDPFVKIQP